MKLGIVTTADIAGNLCSTINQRKDLGIILEAVYSRSIEKADKFKDEHQINHSYDSYEEMLSSDIDGVYISSPNSLHFAQAKEAIMAGKHVLVEKPLAQSKSQVNELYNLAAEHNVFIMEALVSLNKEPLKLLKDWLKTQEVKMIDFHFAKQTRHYEAYKNGDFVNVFSSEFAGGAINDLGVYTLYPLNYLFGELKNIKAINKEASLGADESSVVIGTTKGALVSIHTSKVTASLTPSQIMTTTNVIEIPQIGICDEVIIKDLNGNVLVTYATNTLKMEDELRHFVTVVNSNYYKSDLYTEELAAQVAEQMQTIRNEFKI